MLWWEAFAAERAAYSSAVARQWRAEAERELTDLERRALAAREELDGIDSKVDLSLLEA